MAVNFDELPPVFRRLPEGLARLAAGWQMVPADDPAQVAMTVPAHIVAGLRAANRGTLLLVGALDEIHADPADTDPGEVVRQIVATNGVVVRRRPAVAAVYSRFVVRVTDIGSGIYECASPTDAVDAAAAPRVRSSASRSRATASELRDARRRLRSARANAAAHHTVLAALSEALEPIIAGGSSLAAEVARDVLGRQQRTTAEMDDDLSQLNATVASLGAQLEEG